jgi:hypothetical protein
MNQLVDEENIFTVGSIAFHGIDKQMSGGNNQRHPPKIE